MIVQSTLLQAKSEGRKLFAVLIDPDKSSTSRLDQVIRFASPGLVDFFFVGGSLVSDRDMVDCLAYLRKHTSIPVVIFPGGHNQVVDDADAILLLSLISGRNPEYLIGQHVQAAPRLRQSSLEILPTGYMLIDGNSPTAVQFISQTQPIPANQTEIAAHTALAGEQLGLRVLFADAGSGARNPVPAAMITAIRQMTHIPLIVGGGIRTPADAGKACKAGADLIVIGNGIEEDPGRMLEFARSIHSPSPMQA